MVIDFNIQYENTIRDGLAKFRADYLAAFKQMIKVEVIEISRALKHDMQFGAKSGRLYPKSDGTGTYRASAKGETPAVDTGNLLRSIYVYTKLGGMEVTAKTNTRYVSDLIELGREFFSPFYMRRKPMLAAKLKAGNF